MTMIDLLLTTIRITMTMMSIKLTIIITMTVAMTSMITMTLAMLMKCPSVRVRKLSCHARARACNEATGVIGACTCTP